MHFYSSSYIHAYFSISYLLTKLCPTLVTLWTVACQAPLFMGISMQEYCSGLPFPSPGDPSDSGIKLESPPLQENSLLSNNKDNFKIKSIGINNDRMSHSHDSACK